MLYVSGVSYGSHCGPILFNYLIMVGLLVFQILRISSLPTVRKCLESIVEHYKVTVIP